MFKKEITIPKFLHDLHGETSTIPEIALTYLGGLISVAALFAISLQSETDIVWWKFVLLMLTGADIGAGVIANFTRGTNKFYSGHEKKKQRINFILLHILHPAVFLFAINTFSAPSLLLIIFVLAGTFVVNAVKETEFQRVIAAFLVLCGISLLVLQPVSHQLLWWFFPLYMIKLFMAFGIRRYR